MPQAKRILKIEIKRMDDPDPDTSWLGEYSNTRKSEFSIDRAHEEDCASVQDNSEAFDRLERAIAYLQERRSKIGNDSDNPEYWTIDESIDLLADKQGEIVECDCGGENNWNRREYRYFNPSDQSSNGETPEESRAYALRNYERMEALQHGDWSFIGIRAQAEIVIDSVIQRI